MTVAHVKLPLALFELSNFNAVSHEAMSIYLILKYDVIAEESELVSFFKKSRKLTSGMSLQMIADRPKHRHTFPVCQCFFLYT